MAKFLLHKTFNELGKAAKDFLREAASWTGLEAKINNDSVRFDENANGVEVDYQNNNIAILGSDLRVQFSDLPEAIQTQAKQHKHWNEEFLGGQYSFWYSKEDSRLDVYRGTGCIHLNNLDSTN